MVSVAIIDDGIYNGIYNINNIVKRINITAELEVIIENKFLNNKSSHGTVCTAIINKYYCDIEFTSIKVLGDKTNKCTKEQLIVAIEWCIKNGIKVVNISLGTIDFKDFKLINNVINRAYYSGIIIVAACNNNDVFTYPAGASNVIGVKSSSNNDLKEGEYIYNLYPLDGIDIIACSRHQLFREKDYSKITYNCNSYATPMITAKVCEIIAKYPCINLSEIKYNLYLDAINCINKRISVDNCKKIDWITNSVLLCDDICKDYYNIPYIKQVLEFKQINEINLKNSDTFIIISNYIEHYNKIKSFINYYIKKNKNIIFIDNCYKDEIFEIERNNNVSKFWHPSIMKSFFRNTIDSKKIDVPLIIVYGYTESYIIELLNSIIINFRSDGYYAIGAYSMPIAILYGMEYISIEDDENLKTKTEKLYKIYNFDIIILGVLITKKDDIIDNIKLCLNPDISILIKENSIEEVLDFSRKFDSFEILVITTQYDMKKNTHCKNKIINFKNTTLVYKKILKILI